MNWLEIVKWVAIVIFGGLSLYFKTKTKLTGKVAEFINDAEQEYHGATKSGGAKFEWAVNGLYNLVPVPLQPFITKELIGRMVQAAFDKMEDYATQQLDKVESKIESKMDVGTNDSGAASPVE